MPRTDEDTYVYHGDAVTPLTFRDDMGVELIDSMGSDLTCARAAWVSTASDTRDDPEPGHIEGLIGYLIRSRHASPFEHATLTFAIEAPLFVVREWMRHRTQSYNEVSGRYTELPGVFYLPPDGRPCRQVGKPGAYTYEQDETTLRTAQGGLEVAYRHAWDAYQLMLKDGVAREVARIALPVGLYTRWYATANLRNWLGFLSLRTTSDQAAVPSFPMEEIRWAANQLEAFIAERFPITHAAWVQAGRTTL